jgi:hypothetical protein
MRVALFIQHAKRKRGIKLSSVTCPVLPYFLTSSHRWRHFRKEVAEQKVRVLICLESVSF